MIKRYLENPNDNCILKFSITNTNDLNAFNVFVNCIKEDLKLKFGDSSRYKVAVHSKLQKGRLEHLHNSTSLDNGYKRISYVFIIDSITNKPYENLLVLNKFSTSIAS